MAVNLSPIGGVAGQFFDNNGNPLSGGRILTYSAGTTTPQTTYTSAGGGTPHANPIILDAAGRVPGGEIWLTDGLQYKFIIQTSTGVQIGSYDNIIGINSNFVNYTNAQEIQTATAGQTVFTLTTMQYQTGTNSLSVFVDGVNQYGPGSQYAYEETSDTVVTFASGLHVGAQVKFTTSSINASSYGDAEQISYNPPFTGGVTTNVELKLAQTVSVKDFGAVGDGVADDTAAIQMAINASNGKTIYFPNGIYAVGSTILIDSCRCNFIFEKAIVKPISNNFTIFQATVDAYGIKFIDLIVRGTGTTGVTVFDVHRMIRNGAGIFRCEITDVETGIYLNGLCGGILIDFPAIFNVDNPIIVRACAGAVKINHPIIDLNGKSGIGIDIYNDTLPIVGFIGNVGTQIIGGAVEGGTVGIRDNSFNTQVYGTYFERNSEADISLLSNSRFFGGAYTNHTANIGACAIKGRGAYAAQIYHPFMANSARSTGLFDFDNTNVDCYYDIIVTPLVFNTPIGVVTGINTASNKPGPIGGITPSTGAFSTLSSTGASTLAALKTASSSVATVSGVATTLFTITAANRGRYEVVAMIPNSGAGGAALYTAIATVIWDGLEGRIVANNGANLTITLSGANVRVTQTAGTNQTIFWSYTYLSLA